MRLSAFLADLWEMFEAVPEGEPLTIPADLVAQFVTGLDEAIAASETLEGASEALAEMLGSPAGGDRYNAALSRQTARKDVFRAGNVVVLPSAVVTALPIGEAVP